MGNFAENLNLGNNDRFQPPLGFWVPPPGFLDNLFIEFTT